MVVGGFEDRWPVAALEILGLQSQPDERVGERVGADGLGSQAIGLVLLSARLHEE